MLKILTFLIDKYLRVIQKCILPDKIRWSILKKISLFMIQLLYQIDCNIPQTSEMKGDKLIKTLKTMLTNLYNKCSAIERQNNEN